METLACISLKRGMIIAQDVMSHKNDVLVPAGTAVTPEIIDKLKKYNILVVTIKDALDLATTHFERIQASPDFQNFQEVYQTCMTEYQSAVKNLIEKHYTINYSLLMSLYDRMVSCTSSPEKLLDFLYNQMPTEDEITHAHCLKSALICGVFGKWISFSDVEIRTLIQAGFVYDIGKLLVPQELLWKSGKLTEEERKEVQNHTVLGCQLMRNAAAPEEVANTVLTHHERIDGTGYPNGLKDKEISKYAKVLSIIDSYEAMTAARTYRNPLMPFEIIGILSEDAGTKFDSQYLFPILYHLATLQIGSHVRLSDGRDVTVKYINKNLMKYPIVMDENEKLIDLSKEPETKIVTIL